MSSRLTDGQNITTLQGSDVTVTINGDSMWELMVNNATVVSADVGAANGVVHVIDQVLLPANFMLPSKYTVNCPPDGCEQTNVFPDGTSVKLSVSGTGSDSSLVIYAESVVVEDLNTLSGIVAAVDLTPTGTEFPQPITVCVSVPPSSSDDDDDDDNDDDVVLLESSNQGSSWVEMTGSTYNETTMTVCAMTTKLGLVAARVVEEEEEGEDSGSALMIVAVVAVLFAVCGLCYALYRYTGKHQTLMPDLELGDDLETQAW
jgi:hypothetical protein